MNGAMATGKFFLDPNTPREQRVYMKQGRKLVDDEERQYVPSYRELRRACEIGTRLGMSRKARRVKCPSRIGPTKRWTTRAAYEWYLDQLNGDAE